MTQPPASPEFTALWPTTLMRHTLPGADAANPILAQLIEEMDGQSADMTADYLGGNLFAHPHPALGWLKSCLDRAVLDYARHIGIAYDLDWRLQAWPNLNRFGDYHNLHNHPHSWASGTYYARVPSGEAPAGGRSDRDPNAIDVLEVEPMPFHAMSGFPYGADEHFPSGEKHLEWRREWNTRPAHRWFAPISPRRAQELLDELSTQLR